MAIAMRTSKILWQVNTLGSCSLVKAAHHRIYFMLIISAKYATSQADQLAAKLKLTGMHDVCQLK